MSWWLLHTPTTKCSAQEERLLGMWLMVTACEWCLWQTEWHRETPEILRRTTGERKRQIRRLIF
jgi:hypothetical protein